MYCAVTLYTGVAWGFGNTQFSFCNTHTETERLTLTDEDTNVKLPTTAVNPLLTADAKNSLSNPVSTPFSTK